MKDTKEKPKKDVLGIISIINAIALIGFAVSGVSDGFLFVSVAIFIFLDYIAMPYRKEKEEDMKNKNILRKAILKSLVSLIFLIALFRILVGYNYNLKYTYYIAILCLFLIFLHGSYESISRRYKEDKEEGKKRYNIKFIYIIFVNVVIAIAFPLIIFGLFSIDKESVVISKLVEPQAISMTRITEDYYKKMRDFDFSYNSEKISIDSPEAIKKIVKDIQGKKVENISGVDLINYERMSYDYRDRYQLQFDYGEYGKIQGLEEGYIYFITITSNEKVFIEQINLDEDYKLFSNNHMLYYPVELSKETMDIINTYKKDLERD